MYLRMIKHAAMLISLMFVSPILKYQPDLLTNSAIGMSETEAGTSAVIPEIAESETVTQETKITGAVVETVIETQSAEKTIAETEETVTGTTVEKGLETEAEMVCKEPKSEIVISETEMESADTMTNQKSSSLIMETVSMVSETEVPATKIPTSEVHATEVSVNETPVIEVSVAEAPTKTPTVEEHSHIWIPVTETVHHDAVYQIIHHEALTERVWVEDKPAWDETYENTIIVAIHAICKGCGIDLNEAGMTDEEYDEHDRQHILNGGDSSYYEAPIYQTVTETVHHEAEGHYGDVVVQGAYDEAVLVSEAWDEEVFFGYICEECGEVR